MTRRLAIQSTLPIKQNALKEIFRAGRVLHLFTQNIFIEGFSASHTSEAGQDYFNNHFTTAPSDYVKIISSEIWDDGSGIAKIKVFLQYDTHVQAYTNTGAWLPEIKHITGTMQTFYTVL